MDLSDLLGGGGHTKRPDHPDFWRIADTMMAMKADMSDAKDHAEQERRWRKRVEDLADFDSLAYHATQVALSICEIETGAQMMRMSANTRNKFVSVMQAFYDGFIAGAEYEKQGGHRER